MSDDFQNLRKYIDDDALVKRILSTNIKNNITSAIFFRRKDYDTLHPVYYYTRQGFSLQDAVLINLYLDPNSKKFFNKNNLMGTLFNKSTHDNRLDVSFFDDYLSSDALLLTISEAAEKPPAFFIEKYIEPKNANILADLVGKKLYDFLVTQQIHDIQLDDAFFENYNQSGLHNISFQNAVDRSADFFEYMGLDPGNSKILESIVASAESISIQSQIQNRVRSPMQYTNATKALQLPEMTNREIYYLVNNYSEKRKQCVDLCLLKSRPLVGLNATNAGKLLPNVNPFRFLNSTLISVHNLDIETLVQVGDFLLNYSRESLVKSIELLLRKYFEKSNLRLLLYADCLIGFYIWGLADNTLYPMTVYWGSQKNPTITEIINPIPLLENYGWVFFDMIMNLTHLITIIKNKIPITVKHKKNKDVIVANLDDIKDDMYDYFEYNASAFDGFMSNYYNDKLKLATNCVFSTLLEACVIQERGVPSHKIFLRLEDAYSNHTNYPNRQRYKLLKIPNKKFEGSRDATHWASTYKKKILRSAFDSCTDKKINFGENKLEVAMLIIYPIFSHVYQKLQLGDNIEIWKSRINDVEDSESEKVKNGEHFYNRNIKNLLLLERDVRTILENTIPASLIIPRATVTENYEKKLQKSKKHFMENFKLNKSGQKSKRLEEPTRRVRSRY